LASKSNERHVVKQRFKGRKKAREKEKQESRARRDRDLASINDRYDEEYARRERKGGTGLQEDLRGINVRRGQELSAIWRRWNSRA
jgi:hypothetical protein